MKKFLLFFLMVNALDMLHAQKFQQEFGNPRKAFVEAVATPSHADSRYDTGQQATLRVVAREGGMPLQGTWLRYKVGPEMFLPERYDSVAFKDGEAVIPMGTMNEPGFLACQYEFPTTEGRPWRDLVKVAFSPEQIKTLTPMPCDFEQFWQGALAEARKVPFEAEFQEVPDATDDRFVTRLVRLRVGKNKWMQGYLTIPRSTSLPTGKDGVRGWGSTSSPQSGGSRGAVGSRGAFPVVLCPPGAGSQKIYPSDYFPKQGCIYLKIEIHDNDQRLPDDAYNEMRQQKCDGYMRRGMASKDTYYYKDVYVGCARAVDFLCSLPEWDGKNVIVTGGSQGGALTIVTAALNEKVTLCAPFYPALCDLTGFLHQRAGGWPKFFSSWSKDSQVEIPQEQAVETLQYFDVVNFARLLKVPTFMSWGYSDDTCSPTSVWAAWNEIKAPKANDITPSSGHWRFPASWDKCWTWMKGRLWPQPPVMGRSSQNTDHVNISDLLMMRQTSERKTGIELSKLTVEGRISPLGLDDQKPRFGWQIASDKKNVMQQSYRLFVASSDTLCQEGKADVWDSQTVASDRSQWVEYQGRPLQPNTRYFWRVMVKTNKGSQTSRVQSWSTGLLSAANWQGQWIGYDSITPDVRMERHSRIAVRHLKKTFTVQKPVKRATLHVCGLGYYILNINGQRIGDYLLAPAPTQYDKAAIYDTYDVTSQFSARPNGTLSPERILNSCVPIPELRSPTRSLSVASDQRSSAQFTLEVLLAGGYFFPMTQNYQTNVRTAFGMPKLRLNLMIDYEDGTHEILATDSTWQIAVDGPIRYANLYDGTLIDYRMQPAQWMPVQVVAAPCDILRGNVLGGVKAYATESTISLTKTGTRRFILDFGTNNTGRVWLPSVAIPQGDTVCIRYAETLKDDGRGLYTDNLREAQNTDLFVGNGAPVTLTTEFLWHGFRYIEVSGLKEDDAKRIQRQLMTDDLVSAASIEIDERPRVGDGSSWTSQAADPSAGMGDGMLNRIIGNARRGILSNYKGIPMDCPQRDERMPWLGDRTMGCFGESYLTYNHTLYAKWLQDICDAQRPNGSISDVSPAYWRLYNGNITWPAALPFGMEMLRLQYGDERPWQEHAENVKSFLAFAKKKSGKDGLITYDRYGDWCVPPASLDEVLTKDSARLTDGTLLSSCYYYYICKLMGMDEEAALTRDAINRTFLKDGCYANGTVTANLLPLAMDIIPQEQRDSVTANFVRRVKAPSLSGRAGGEASPHIDCGVIGISWLMRYLSKAGLGDVAYQIASTKTYPGWGYMVENGATTIWELWNGNTANPSMNSGNHVMMLGDLIPWAFEFLAGIAPDPAQPGFKHIIMRPDFSITALRGVTATYPSLYGAIGSDWQRESRCIVWKVEIPANTTATLHFPNGKTKTVGSGQYTFEVK